MYEKPLLAVSGDFSGCVEVGPLQGYWSFEPNLDLQSMKNNRFLDSGKGFRIYGLG